jgi:DHA2 family multidrug resistance protein
VQQDFARGTLIPAVFLLFPTHRQGVATPLVGVLAVLAPTVGPTVGGQITETYASNWLFLISVAPGIGAAVLASVLLPTIPTRPHEVRTLDIVPLVMIGVALGRPRDRA